MSDDQVRHHRLDYLEISVTDMAGVSAFYTKAFGWEMTEYAPQYVGFGMDGQEFGGFSLVDEVPPPVEGAPLAILFSSDLESSEQSVRDAGGVISTELFSFPGGRRFHFRDPAGNEFAVHGK